MVSGVMKASSKGAVYPAYISQGVVKSQLGVAPWSEIAFQAVFQGLGSVVISGISFTRMIQYFGPVRSTMITAVVPGLSALGAVYFLGEPLYWNLLAGLALVTMGILFGVRTPKLPPGWGPAALAAQQALSNEPPKIYPAHLLFTTNYRLPVDVDRCQLEVPHSFFFSIY